MKSPETIDSYLAELGRRVGRGSGRDDFIAETEDHLRAATADAVRRGASPLDAERAAIERYGPPRQVARDFARSVRQGAAVATRFTHWGGLACMALPVLFALGLALNRGPRGAEPGHAIGLTAQVLLYPTLLIAVAALARRHGGLRRGGTVAVIVLALTPLLVLPLSYWGLAVGALIYAAVFGVLAVGLFRAAILPRPALLLLFAGPVVVTLVAAVITAFGGDAAPIFVLGLVSVLAAFAWFGWAMWSEETLLDSAPRRVVA